MSGANRIKRRPFYVSKMPLDWGFFSGSVQFSARLVGFWNEELEAPPVSAPYDLKPHIRTVKDYPIAGVEFRDITSLLEPPAAYVPACNAMTNV